MKTVFSSHQQVCHVWASRSQETGTGGNISFQGNVILSYHWWPMANFINDNTVLCVNHSYSNSTSKHLNKVHRAIPDYYKKIYCYNVGSQYNDKPDHKANIENYLSDIKKHFDNFKTSRKYKYNIINWQAEIINTMVEYCQLFNLDIPSYTEYSLNNDVYLLQASKQEAHNKEIESKKEEKRRSIIATYGSELTKLQIDWINGKTNKTSIYDKFAGNMQFDKTYLRQKDNTIETSQGANVPIREAKILFDRIQAGKDIKGFKIGYYTVISLNGVLKIGCHEIERDEINRIASFLNW